MNITVRASDTLTADLLRRLRGMDAGRRRAALEAVGLGLASMARRAFNTSPDLRPSPWANKKDGSPSTLQKSTRLRQSVRVTSVSPNHVSVGTEAAYGRIHQLGGKTRPHVIKPKKGKALAFTIGGKKITVRRVNHPGSDIPARPYLPFDRNGVPTAKADRMIKSVLQSKLSGKP